MTQNHELDDIFAELRAHHKTMPEGLSQRVLADALRIQSEIAPAPLSDTPPAQPRSWFHSLREKLASRITLSPFELGASGAGFAVALIAGVWFGINPPQFINTALEVESVNEEVLTFIDPSLTDNFELIAEAM